MTVGLVNCCKKKYKLYKEFKIMHSDDAKNKYLKYRNKLKIILSNAERNFYLQKFDYYKGNAKKTWETLNKLLNRSTNSNLTEEIKVNGKLTCDNTLIAETFNEYFANIGEN